MRKKKLIIITSIVALVGLVTAGCIYGVVKHNENLRAQEEQERIRNTIVSTLTIDVNPSIEVNLNKDNEVISVKPLSEDSKKLLENTDFKWNSLEDTIGTLITTLKDNAYLDGEAETILINVDSEDKQLLSLVHNSVEKATQEREIAAEVVMLSVKATDELKELAEQNNITVSKAYYIREQIKGAEGLKIEDLKDASISEIKVKAEEKKDAIKKEEEKAKAEAEAQKNQNNRPSVAHNPGSSTGGNTGGNSDHKGSIEKCLYVKENISLEQAINIAVSARGGKYNPAGYCDVRSADAYGSLSPEGICSIMVSYDYQFQNCTYHISVETGQILGSPVCKKLPVTTFDTPCVIMRDMGVTEPEQSGITNQKDMGSEIVSLVEDRYGNIYEYHISKENGAIISKILIQKAGEEFVE